MRRICKDRSLPTTRSGSNNPEIFNGIVVGPWVHGGWARYDGNHLGSVSFASNTGQFFRSQILFPFFEQYLKGGGDAKLPAAYVFETGTNIWRQYPSWPPKNTESKTLYFRENGGLSFERSRRCGGSFRRIRERSEQTGAVCGLSVDFRTAGIYGRGPAIRCQQARRAGLSD